MKKPLIILFLLVFFLSSCGLAGPQIVTQATVAMAAEAQQDTDTPVATKTTRPTRTPTQPPATLTPTPLPTDTPTITPTATPVVIRACVQQYRAVNVRNGPRLSAPRIKILELGSCVDLIARSRDKAWAKYEDGWIQVELVELADSVELLPIVER